jgi:serine/threonine-protein kinase
MGGLFLLGVGLVFMVLLARRNWKLGRTDRRGAWRLAVARFFIGLFIWVGTVHAVPSPFLMFAGLAAVGDWLVSAAIVWLLYLALEPALRARWPQSIVTWNRLLGGRWLDAQVGAHVLIGAALGSLLWICAEMLGHFLGPPDVLAQGGRISQALGVRDWAAGHARTAAAAVTGGLIIFFAIFCIRVIVRKEAIAAILAALLLTAGQNMIFVSPDWKVLVAIYIMLHTVLIFGLLRLGLVTTISAIFFLNSFNAVTLGGDWQAWFAPAGLASLLLLLGLAVFAFWRSLGSRQLLGGQESGGGWSG